MKDDCRFMLYTIQQEEKNALCDSCVVAASTTQNENLRWRFFYIYEAYVLNLWEPFKTE